MIGKKKKTMVDECKPFTFQNMLCALSKLAFACGSNSLSKIYNKSEIASLERQSFQSFSAYY